MAFTDLGVTRRKVTSLPSQAWATGATLTFPVPRVGLLARIYLAVRGNAGGTVGTVDAFGFCGGIRRVRTNINSTIEVDNFSGEGYAYLVAPYLDAPLDPLRGSPATAWGGRTAITAVDFVDDIIIPLQVNLRDPVGLLMLQNEQTLMTLYVDCETLTNITSSGTFAATITPYLEWFTVPDDQKNWPNLRTIHSIIEDQRNIGGAGNFEYQWPRGNTYLSMIHGVTANTAALATAGFIDTRLGNNSQVQLRQNSSDFLQSTDVQTNNSLLQIPYLDMIHGLTRGSTRLTGVIPLDLMGTSGLGIYDQMRDTINSALVTDLATVINAAGAGTFYAVRRQLVPLVSAKA